MIITTGEAIEILEHLAEIIRSGDYQETFKMAASALRPITREQVEMVWRGEWIDCSNGWMCSRCEYDNTYAKPFCPNCGAPMTDEAVETIMKRMEEMRND